MPTLKTLQFSIMHQKIASDLSKVTMIGYLKNKTKQNTYMFCFFFKGIQFCCLGKVPNSKLLCFWLPPLQLLSLLWRKIQWNKG